MGRSQIKGIAATVVFFATIFYMAINSIYFIPISAPLLTWLPIGYWIIILATLGLVFTVLLNENPTKVDFLIVLLLLLVLFIGPEMMEYSVRVRDSYSFLYLSNYVTFPSIYNQTSYSQYNYLPNWPGFFYFVSAMYQVLGLGYYTGAKAVFAIGQAAIVLVSFGLGKSLFGSRRGSVLFGLLIVTIGWDVWPNPSPVLFGAIFLVSIVSVLLIKRGSGSKMLVFAILYLAVTVVHGLTAILLVPLLLILAIYPVARGVIMGISALTRLRIRFGQHLSADLIDVRVAMVIFATVIFSLWFTLAPNAVNGESLLESLNFLLHLNQAPLVSQLTNLTSYRYPSVVTAGVFLGLTAVTLGVALASSLKGYGLISLQSILLLVAAVTFTYLFFPTSQDFYDRIFEDGFPFIVWIIVAGTVKIKWKRLFAILVLILVVSGFAAAYAHEPVLVYPPTENAGDSFLLHHATPNSIIAYLTDGPTAQGVSDSPSSPTMLGFTGIAAEDSRSLLQANIVVNSTVVQDGFLYYYGYSLVNQYVSSHRLMVLYESGSYTIYQSAP